jgi:hypothetical protein
MTTITEQRIATRLANKSKKRRQVLLLTPTDVRCKACRRSPKIFIKAHGIPHTHGVELTDDVWVFDKQGHRVPPPEYATLSIDKLPRFQKG